MARANVTGTLFIVPVTVIAIGPGAPMEAQIVVEVAGHHGPARISVAKTDLGIDTEHSIEDFDVEHARRLIATYVPLHGMCAGQPFKVVEVSRGRYELRGPGGWGGGSGALEDVLADANLDYNYRRIDKLT